MEYGWIWIAVIVLSVIIEAITDQLLCIWFVPGAIVATVLDFFDTPLIWQILVFLVLSIVGILFFRKMLTRVTTENSKKTNIQAIIGEKCVVTERIDNFAGCGLARVRGQIWSARGVGENDVYEVGEVLQIVAIEGVKLICKK